MGDSKNYVLMTFNDGSNFRFRPATGMDTPAQAEYVFGRLLRQLNRARKGRMMEVPDYRLAVAPTEVRMLRLIQEEH